MRSAKRVGRALGLLILAQMTGGLVVSFVLLRPLASPEGFLEAAAAHPLQLGAAALLTLAVGAVTVGVAITGWPVFRRYSERLALWLLALAVVSFGLIAAEGGAVMSMLTLSQAHASTATPDAGLFGALAEMAAAARRWAHYPNVLVAGGMAFVLYALLFRFALVPRLLAGAGLVAALLQMVTVSLPFLGREVILPLIAPLGLVHLILGAWLMARGLEERPGRAAEAT